MIGKRVGQYKIVEEIGAGGMGTVYRARQLSLNRDVALKILPSHLALDPAGLERFRREAMSVAQLAHPNIVQVHDIGEDNGVHFIAMEYVRGRTATELLNAEGPLAFRKALEICAPIAAALGVAHKAGIVHRDVKPSNILLGDAGFVKLADFGVAGLMQPPEGERLTMTGATVGTPYYMSPEQVRGREALDGASDVYSLGVVLYELLSGVHPFGDATPTEAIAKQMHEPFPPIRRYRPDIPDELEQVLGRCLAKNRAERYQDGAELCQALEKARLRIEFGQSDSGGASEEYRKRATGTGFFYVDEAQKSDARMAVGLLALCQEMVAQVRDPHKKQRKALQALYTQSLLARDEYKRVEKQLDELRKRLTHHQNQAAQHKAQTQRLIATGKSEEAAASAEKEAICDRLALDYAHQAQELGKQVRELRDRYDQRREAHAEVADELALLDAEARRAGKAIPGGSANPDLGRHARNLRNALLLVLLLAGAGGLGVLLFAYRPHPSPPVRAAVPAPVAPKRASKDGLLLHYPFDNAENGMVTDQSGAGNDGIVRGSVAWTKEGVGNGACRLDDERSYIEIPDNPTLHVQQMTLAAWVKPVLPTSASGDSPRTIFTKESPGRATGYRLDAMMGRAGLDAAIMSGGAAGTGYYMTPTPLLWEEKWYFIAFTYDGAIRRLYVNDVLLKEIPGSYPIAHSAQSLGVGGCAIQGKGCWNGLMDEVRLYDRALDTKELHALFSDGISSIGAKNIAQVRPIPARKPAGASIPADGLVLHYSFDENEGNKVADLTGRGHEGLVCGATWTPQGCTGGAYEFNGRDAAIEIPALWDLNDPDELTVSVWLRFDDLRKSSYPICKDSDGGYSLRYFAPDRTLSFIFSGTAYGGSTYGRLKERQWHHVAFVYGNGRMVGYVDGVSAAERNDVAPLRGLCGPLLLGGEGLGKAGGSWWFRGAMDELRVYRKALTEEEIRKLYGDLK